MEVLLPARAYPVGHFDLYHGAAFQQVVTDQVRFLYAHLEQELNRVAEQEEIPPG